MINSKFQQCLGKKKTYNHDFRKNLHDRCQTISIFLFKDNTLLAIGFFPKHLPFLVVSFSANLVSTLQWLSNSVRWRKVGPENEISKSQYLSCVFKAHHEFYINSGWSDKFLLTLFQRHHSSDQTLNRNY